MAPNASLEQRVASFNELEFTDKCLLLATKFIYEKLVRTPKTKVGFPSSLPNMSSSHYPSDAGEKWFELFKKRLIIIALPRLEFQELRNDTDSVAELTELLELRRL